MDTDPERITICASTRHGNNGCSVLFWLMSFPIIFYMETNWSRLFVRLKFVYMKTEITIIPDNKLRKRRQTAEAAEC